VPELPVVAWITVPPLLLVAFVVADVRHADAMLAVFETGAHLDLLASQGRVVLETDEEGVRRYR